MISRRFKRYLNKYKRVIAGILFAAILVTLGGYIVQQSNSRESGTLHYASKGVSVPWLPETVLRFKKIIEHQAKQYDVDANLIAIIMTLESGGYTKADSGQAQGLMQVTPYTGSDIASKFLREPQSDYDLFDTETSVEFGVAYIRYLREEFCTHMELPDANYCVELIAAGYNGGPGAANSLYKGEGLNDVQTATYSRNALNMWRERAASKSPTYERWLNAGGQSLITAAQNEM